MIKGHVKNSGIMQTALKGKQTMQRKGINMYSHHLVCNFANFPLYTSPGNGISTNATTTAETAQ
jgi:hypothetical protein